MRPMARLRWACLILFCGTGPAFAQEQPLVLPALLAQAWPETTAQPALAAPAAERLELEIGTGRLVRLPGPASTVLAADPRIARVQPASATTLFVMGVAPGRTTIIATADNGVPIAEYDVNVTAAPLAEAAAKPGLGEEKRKKAPLNAAAVQAAIHRTLTGGADVRVQASDDSLVLAGTVATGADAQAVMAMARSHLDEGQTVVNQLTILSGIQVNVRVRAIEISRQVTRELGFNWQALFSSGSFAIGFATGGVTTPLFAGAAIGNQILGKINNRPGNMLGTGLPNRLGIGYRSENFDINALIDALAADQLITVLAEPNLTAQSGETASFLAGGEFPVPVAAKDDQITIEFKPFGVSLSFVPTVLAPDRLNLRVRPEVSELTENGSISVPLASGTVRIPALSVRRAETTVELGSGQSFAIAGLLQRSSAQLTNGVLGLSEVPVLGTLFKSEAFRRNETELVIIVTPYLVRPVSDPQALATPLDGFRPATDLERILLNRQVAREVLPAPLDEVPFDAGFILE